MKAKTTARTSSIVFNGRTFESDQGGIFQITKRGLGRNDLSGLPTGTKIRVVGGKIEISDPVWVWVIGIEVLPNGILSARVSHSLSFKHWNEAISYSMHEQVTEKLFLKHARVDPDFIYDGYSVIGKESFAIFVLKAKAQTFAELELLLRKTMSQVLQPLFDFEKHTMGELRRKFGI